MKKVEKLLKKLKEEDLNRLEKHQYNDKDDLDYKRNRQMEHLFDKINENYYKPIKTKGAFNNNYLEYESRGEKHKNLSPEDYFDLIRPYLRNMKNNHKTHGEWKIQLPIWITFTSSLNTIEVCIMNPKSDNVEVIVGIKTNDNINELFNLF